MNIYQGEGTSPGKLILIKPMTRLNSDFFQIAISLLPYVAIFSGQLYFQSNYFDTTITFLEQLFLQRICFIWRAPFLG